VPDPHLRVLVTGATGAVGPAVVRAVAAAGHHVRLLVRRVPDDPALAAHERCVGDLTDAAAVAAAVRDVDVVVHLAGLLHVTDPGPELEPEYDRINADATGQLIEATRRAGGRRLVLASTTAVYGDTGARLATEDTVPAPDTWYARSKLAAERRVLEARRDDGTPLGTVLRLSAVYGPRVKGNYRRLVVALARGRFVPLGPGLNRRSLIHEGDVGPAFLAAAASPAAAGRVYNLSDGTPHRVRDIVDAISDALGRSRPRLGVPLPLARAIAGVAEGAFGLIGRRAPLTRAAIAKYVEHSAVDAGRIAREIGFVAPTPLAEGWRLTVAALREHGDLPRRA
jgi:UDP-glucose 4-epimerase